VKYGKKYLYLLKIHMCTGGAVVKAWAAQPKDVGSPPACAHLFIKSWRVKRKIMQFRKLYVISA
jgi:hypothetical protein